MGLLDNVIGAIGANSGSGAAAAGADPLQAIVGMLGQGGGLGGLVQQLQQGGLGDIAASWIGSGPNQPVSANALGQVLNSDMVAGFARQLGIDPQQALAVLSTMLPQLVDQLTPNGQLPQGDIGTALGGLGGQGGAGGLGDLAGMLGGLLNKR